jgi:iron complex outermembrane receptor protein
LVLVDGRRLGIGDPNTGNPNPSPDINQIPAQLVERVEVLTGGASATYGSDAIAGVVNFIMKRNFSGVQLDAQWGVNQHEQHNDTIKGLITAQGFQSPKKDVWDGKSRDISLVAGANTDDGRGNVTVYITYHDQDPVAFSARDYSACQLNVNGAVPSCAGSSNSNIFYTSDGQSDAFGVLGHAFSPYTTNAATSPPPLFNANSNEYLLHQDTRYTAGFFAKYDINEHFNLYSDFQFMNDRSTTAVAPSGLFQGSGATGLGGFLVNCNNPLMSAQQQSTFCTPAQIAAGQSVDLTIGRRNIEGGPRESDYEHQNYRIVLGTKGEIADGWKYDLYGSYYYTTLSESNDNYFSIARIQNALQVQNVNGVPTCISGGKCVPYNIFSEGGVTDAQVNYLNASGSQYGTVREAIVEANITGDLSKYGIKSPWAEDGVGVNIGAQTRRDHLTFRPDEASLSGDLSGFGGAATAIDNSLRASEAYGEIRVPLMQKRPWVEDLVADAGYRYSDYSTGIQAKTYKVGLQYAPTEDIRFRISYQKAIRAPNIIELYTPQAVTNTSQLASDPCAPTLNTDGTTTAATATLAQCQRTGVTAAQYGNGLSTSTIVQCPANQCAVLNGGNPQLDPEKAKTFSVGFTLTPTFISGLTASLDYYRIKLRDTIGSIPLGIVVNNCLNSGDPTFCNSVVRAPNGTLFGTSQANGGYVVGTSINVGAGETSGIDLQANYNLPLENWGWDKYGGVSVNFIGSYLMDAKTTPLAGEPTYDCAGLFGPQCQTLNPEWRHTLRVNWKTPWNVLASVAWRYIGKTELETDSSQPTIGGALTPDPFNHSLPARNYLDLTGVWDINGKYSLRAGITNILDQDPPLVNSAIAGSGTPNTYPTYDLLGRHMFVGFTANF